MTIIDDYNLIILIVFQMNHLALLYYIILYIDYLTFTLSFYFLYDIDLLSISFKEHCSQELFMWR